MTREEPATLHHTGKATLFYCHMCVLHHSYHIELLLLSPLLCVVLYEARHEIKSIPINHHTFYFNTHWLRTHTIPLGTTVPTGPAMAAVVLFCGVDQDTEQIFGKGVSIRAPLSRLPSSTVVAHYGALWIYSQSQGQRHTKSSCSCCSISACSCSCSCSKPILNFLVSIVVHYHLDSSHTTPFLVNRI